MGGLEDTDNIMAKRVRKYDREWTKGTEDYSGRQKRRETQDTDLRIDHEIHTLEKFGETYKKLHTGWEQQPGALTLILSKETLL